MATINIIGTDLSVSESGNTTTFTIALSDNPSGVVVVNLSSDDNGEVMVPDATVVFDATNGTTPQIVTLTGANDTEVDGDQVSTITAVVDFSQDTVNFPVGLSNTINVTTTDDEAAGFALSQTTATVGEEGTTSTFTVSLTGQPASNVTFTVNSTDTDEEEVTVSDETLTFTPENWFTPQTITLTGVDDDSTDGNQVSTITLSVDDANSDDAFDDLADQMVTVTTTDDDTAGFSLNKTSATVSEDGTTTTETVTITLDAKPISSVTLNITPSDGEEVSVSPNSVTIEPDDWDTGATITLTGVADGVVDGDQTTAVTVSVDDASSDDAFDTLDDQTVTVTTTDAETAGFILSQTSATVSENDDTTDQVTFTLSAEPVSDVVLKIAVADATEVTASATTVTLTSDNWDTGVAVDLFGVEDSELDSDQTTTVSVSVDAVNSDDAFDNLAAQDITVTTIDSMECFLTGTHILTDRGEVTVETLTIGDRVLTANGTYESIKWVGRQTIEPSRIKYPLRGYPILIKASALGDNLPHRDLYVSPDHAMLVEGLLINAGALVNGRSILNTEPTETFTYYHVELNQHSLLVVEGTAAESYLPQKEDRSWYDNGDEYEALYPHNSVLAYWPMNYARVSSKRQLPRFVSKQLEKRANALYGEYAVAG